MRKPYPSDLTDAQGEAIKPLIPVSRVGRPRTVDLREVLNAIFFLDRAGCPWDMLGYGNDSVRNGPLSSRNLHVAREAEFSAESCIRKAVAERGFTPGPVGLADAKAEDEAASRWADCAFAYGD